MTDTREPDSLGAQPYPGTQGGGRQYQGYDQYEAGPLPGERPGAEAGPAQPYTPPQAYPTPEQPGVRRPRTGRAPSRVPARRGCGWPRPTRGR
ncbi:hypothetical protein ACFQVA_20385 [Actinomadura keratinilytica]